ncbi:hypothetical protein CC2G_003127 [Coprinopsis cinerea AmutBmut pab1-1]|nr:hypothetical protein CC2G_003127 [Coprinopsis cinerea AmutBmut pab1-1]
MTFQYVTPARKRKRNKENEGPIEFQFQNYTPASTSFKKPRVPLQEITPQAKEAAKAEYIRLQEEMKNAGEKRLQDQVEEGMERLKEAVDKTGPETVGKFIFPAHSVRKVKRVFFGGQDAWFMKQVRWAFRRQRRAGHWGGHR